LWEIASKIRDLILPEIDCTVLLAFEVRSVSRVMLYSSDFEDALWRILFEGKNATSHSCWWLRLSTPHDICYVAIDAYERSADSPGGSEPPALPLSYQAPLLARLFRAFSARLRQTSA
jgi:hypothetical protein